MRKANDVRPPRPLSLVADLAPRAIYPRLSAQPAQVGHLVLEHYVALVMHDPKELRYETAEFSEKSLGWFVNLGGLSIGVGKEKPDLVDGQQVRLIIEALPLDKS